jgi:hypothetical protein
LHVKSEDGLLRGGGIAESAGGDRRISALVSGRNESRGGDGLRPLMCPFGLLASPRESAGTEKHGIKLNQTCYMLFVYVFGGHICIKKPF